MFSIHQIISSEFIYPSRFVRIITPDGKICHGTFTSLKIINGGNFVPSAIQESTTVKFDFLCPVVRMLTVLEPVSSTVILLGISKVKGVSSIFPIKLKE